MKKLNIAKLLKDCPTGMELDSTIVNELYFDEITEDNMIKCYTKHSNEFTSICNFIYFYFDGSYLDNTKAKCVIFPKGKTTWEGFQRPFKDGDIIFEDRFHSICIFKKEGTIKGTVDYYCGMSFGRLCVKDEKDIDEHYGDISDYRLATKEERQKLFDAIKANGYKWNDETKTLEKLEVNKFDITTLKPFESKVLVRTSNHKKWVAAFYSHYDKDSLLHHCVVGGLWYEQCIPYEGNEHLLGTTNDCDDYYKTWK